MILDSETPNNNSGATDEIEPEFQKLYQILGEQRNLNNELSRFKSVAPNGSSQFKFTAKIYRKNQDGDYYLTKYLKDVVFSSIIEHENVISPIDIFRHPKRIHIVDYIGGGTLAERFRLSLGVKNDDEIRDAKSTTRVSHVGEDEDAKGEDWPPGPISYTEMCAIMYKLLEVVQKMHECKLEFCDMVKSIPL